MKWFSIALLRPPWLAKTVIQCSISDIILLIVCAWNTTPNLRDYCLLILFEFLHLVNLHTQQPTTPEVGLGFTIYYAELFFEASIFPAQECIQDVYID